MFIRKSAILVVISATFLSAEMMDFAAGYDDGCSSARGHFSRSSFAFENIPSYKEGWLKGKKECEIKGVRRVKKKRHRVKTRKVKKYAYRCKDNPWITFSRGWDDGYSSARGRWIKRANRCPEYYRGWSEGFDHCKCEVMGDCIEEVFIDS